MTQLFISHSSQDGAFMCDLRTALANHSPDVWIDSRELCGDPLRQAQGQQHAGLRVSNPEASNPANRDMLPHSSREQVDTLLCR